MQNQTSLDPLTKPILEYEFGILFGNHFKNLKELVWYKIYEIVIEKGVSFNDARNQWLSKNRLECTKDNALNLQILEYAKKLKIDLRTSHEDAKIIHSGEYSDYYKCPYCSLEFKVELPDA